MVRSMYFISDLFKNASSNSMLRGRVIDEEGIGKDMEGSSCDPF